jgi:hypothetical protein
MLHVWALPQPPQPIQTPIARMPFDSDWPTHHLGALAKECPFCRALHWIDERLTNSSIRNPKFGTCCYQGKVILPDIQSVPQELYNHFISTESKSTAFRNKIRQYNSALAMTSVGRAVDNSVNDGNGPYVFKLHGELTHRVGCLLPPEGETPKYAQLYLYDTDVSHNYRMGNRFNTALDPIILHTLQDMLYNWHPAVQFFKQAYEITLDRPRDQNCMISLHFQEGCDWNRYNTPSATTNEIALILPGDGDQVKDSQDIILYHRGGTLSRIDDCHPFYPALRYVLLFPKGQLGWYPQIPKQDVEAGIPEQEKYVTLAEYHRYRFHIRPLDKESNHLFLAGKLFQEYVVES